MGVLPEEEAVSSSLPHCLNWMLSVKGRESLAVGVAFPVEAGACPREAGVWNEVLCADKEQNKNH